MRDPVLLFRNTTRHLMVLLDNTMLKTNPQNRTEGGTDVALSVEKAQVQRACKVGF